MIINYASLLIFTFIASIIYFKFAKLHGIVDEPNSRSAHSEATIRGGGIIFLISLLLYYILFNETPRQFFITPLILVSVVSFIDDVKSLPAWVRLLVHIIAMTMLFYDLEVLAKIDYLSILIVSILFVLCIGFLNIYNFMDGINGISFLNAIVTFGTLVVINETYQPFIESSFLIAMLVSLFVFGFFNFRQKAIFFAGDIGSIILGIIIIYATLKLFLASSNPLVFLLLGVYSIDGGLTMIIRLFNGDNISKPHKNHMYQRLIGLFNYSHIKISIGYFIAQLLINLLVLLIWNAEINLWILSVIIFTTLCLIYLVVKKRIS